MKKLFVLFYLLTFTIGLFAQTYYEWASEPQYIADNYYTMIDSGVAPVVPGWSDPYFDDLISIHYLSEAQLDNTVHFEAGTDMEGVYDIGTGNRPGCADPGIYFQSRSHLKETSSPSVIGGTKNISWAGWVNMTNAVLNRGLFCIYDGSSQAEFGAVVVSADDLTVRLNQSTTEGDGQLTLSNFPEHEWVHVAVTYDAEYIKLYTNGVFAVSNSYSATLDCTGLQYLLGRYRTTALMWGLIDKPYLYERTLTDSEVLALYSVGRTNNAVNTISTNNLISFSTCTRHRIRARDSSGNGNNFLPLASSDNTATFFVNAGTVRVADFDGTDDELVEGWEGYEESRYRIGTDEVTVSAWFKVDAHKNYNAICGNGILSGSHGFGLYTDASGNLVFQIREGTPVLSLVQSGIVAGEWYHVQAVRKYNSGTGLNECSLYTNGVLCTDASATGTEAYDVQPTAYMAIADSIPSAGRRFNGQLYRVAFYDGAFENADEVFANTHPTNSIENRPNLSYTKNVFAGGEDHLWYFDDNQPTGKVYDVSGNDYHFNMDGFFSPYYFVGKEGFWSRANQNRLTNAVLGDVLGVASNLSGSMWVKSMRESASGEGLMYSGSYLNNHGKIAFWSGNDNLILRVNGSISEGNGQLTVANVMTTNEWHHIGWTYDGLGLCVYFDGELAGTNSWSDTIDFTGLPFYLTTAYSLNYIYQGFFKEVRLYERTLDEEDMYGLFSAGRHTPATDVISTDGLLFHLPITNDPSGVLNFADDFSSPSISAYPNYDNTAVFDIIGGTNDNGVWTEVFYDGIDDYSMLGYEGQSVVKDNNPTDIGTNDFTLVTWFKWHTATRWGPISGRKFLDGSADDGFGMFTGTDATIANYLYGEVRDSTERTLIKSDTTLETGQWYCGALVREGGSNIYLYVNGELQAETGTNANEIIPPNTSFFTINSRAGGGLPGDFTMKETRFWNGESKSADYLYDLWNETGPYNNEEKLVWSVNHLPSPILEYDFHPNGDETTKTYNRSNASTNEGACSVTAWADGTNGQAYGEGIYQFNSIASDTINIGNVPSSINATKFTISVWAYSTNSGVQGVLSKHRSATERISIFKDGGGNSTAFVVANNANTYGSCAEPSDDGWHRYALVFDGTQPDNKTRLKGYIDGVLQTLSFTGTIPASMTEWNSDFIIGRGDTLNYFGGFIWNPTFYDDALSGAEVMRSYLSEATRLGVVSPFLRDNPALYKIQNKFHLGFNDELRDGSVNNVGVTNHNGAVLGGTSRNGTIELDGSTQYLTASDANFPTGGMARTISIWYQHDNTGLDSILKYGSDDVAYGRIYIFNANPEMRINFSSARTIGISAPRDDSWHNLVYVIPENTNWQSTTVYYDGKYATTSLVFGSDAPVNTIATGIVSIARSEASAACWDGKLDEIDVYSRALSSNEVYTAYTNYSAIINN